VKPRCAAVTGTTKFFKHGIFNSSLPAEQTITNKADFAWYSAGFL